MTNKSDFFQFRNQKIMDVASVIDTSAPEALKADDAKKYLCSTGLFCGNHEVIILHGEEQYRLRRTRQNKLILTK